ncbi:MAG: YggT family protein [Acidimicrobiia bacterium]|nr:YggT family protein [Acidimicrobiia bacterium]
MVDTSDPKSVTVWLVRALAYVAYAWVIVTQLILLQGFLLLLFGANPTSSYVQWAYRSLERVMEPFRGIFTPVELNGDSVLDTSVLFAMFIYGVLILVIRALLDWLTYRLRRLERMHAAEEAAAAIPAGSAVPAAAPPPAAAVAAPPPADQSRSSGDDVSASDA